MSYMGVGFLLFISHSLPELPLINRSYRPAPSSFNNITLRLGEFKNHTKMKIKLFLLVTFNSLVLLGQTTYETELQELRRELTAKTNQINQEPDSQRGAALANLAAEYQEKENQLIVKHNKIEALKRQQEELQSLKTESSSKISPNSYQPLQNYSPLNTYQNVISSLGSGVNSLVMGLQYQAMINTQNELIRRQQVANNFVIRHTEKIYKIVEIYNKIPQNNFTKKLSTGWYNAHFLTKKKYSFYNNQEISTEIPCIVFVENDFIKKINLYGKQQFEITLPQEYPQYSLINNGLATYTNYAKLETYSVLIIEPYLNSNNQEIKLSETEVGSVILYTTNKKDEEKIIYIQEIDKEGNIYRELQSTVKYAKKETELNLEDNIKVNSGYKLLFFGRVTNTPFGTMPLYPKISDKYNEPLADKEIRVIKVKEYRE